MSKKHTKRHHVHRQNMEVLGKVVLGENVIDQMNHHFECQLFVESDHFENESCQDIESLAVARALVKSGVGQKEFLENCVFFVRGETGITGTMKVFDNFYP